jgi:hypothetical protein
MIVGHTIQENGFISTRCENNSLTNEPLIYFIDVGMSSSLVPGRDRFGIAALEIWTARDGDSVVNAVYEHGTYRLN